MALYKKFPLTEMHQLSDKKNYPEWLKALIASNRIMEVSGEELAIFTREGLKSTGPHDWVALDSNGDPYPIANDVHKAMYRLATPADIAESTI